MLDRLDHVDFVVAATRPIDPAGIDVALGFVPRPRHLDRPGAFETGFLVDHPFSQAGQGDEYLDGRTGGITTGVGAVSEWFGDPFDQELLAAFRGFLLALLQRGIGNKSVFPRLERREAADEELVVIVWVADQSKDLAGLWRQHRNCAAAGIRRLIGNLDHAILRRKLDSLGQRIAYRRLQLEVDTQADVFPRNSRRAPRKLPDLHTVGVDLKVGATFLPTYKIFELPLNPGLSDVIVRLIRLVELLTARVLAGDVALVIKVLGLDLADVPENVGHHWSARITPGQHCVVQLD